MTAPAFIRTHAGTRETKWVRLLRVCENDEHGVIKGNQKVFQAVTGRTVSVRRESESDG